MKLTSLVIGPANSYRDLSNDNPLRAVVKLNSRESSVECILSDATMKKMMDLCADEIAQNAKRNVDEFVNAVSAIEGDSSAADILIGKD